MVRQTPEDERDRYGGETGDPAARTVPQGQPDSEAESRLPRAVPNGQKKRLRIVRAAFLSVLILIIAYVLFDPVTSLRSSLKREQGYTYVIGLSVPETHTPWIEQLIKDVAEAEQQYPDLNVIVAEAAGDTAKQIEDLKQLRAGGIDLLMFVMPNPVDHALSNELNAQLTQLADSMPIICLGYPVTDDLNVSFIGYDDQEIGQALMQAILAQQPESGDILLIGGPPDDLISQRRLSGMKTALQKYSGAYKVIHSNWLSGASENRMIDFWVLGNQADLVVAVNDDMALGAYYGTTKLREQLPAFYGMDYFAGLDHGQRLLKDGILEGTVRFESLGRAAVDQAVERLRQPSAERRKVLLGYELIFAE